MSNDRGRGGEEDGGGGDGVVREARDEEDCGTHPGRCLAILEGGSSMHRVIQPAIFLAKLLPPRFISPFDRRIHSRYRSIAFLSPLSPPLFTFSFFLFNFALSLCFLFFFFLLSFSLPLSYFLRGNRPSSCSFSSSSPPFLLSSTVSLLLSRAAERRTHTVVLLARTWRVLFVGIIWSGWNMRWAPDSGLRWRSGGVGWYSVAGVGSDGGASGSHILSPSVCVQRNSIYLP